MPLEKLCSRCQRVLILCVGIRAGARMERDIFQPRPGHACLAMRASTGETQDACGSHHGNDVAQAASHGQRYNRRR